MIKVEYRKTRRNRIQREVREVYLHSDLACGVAGCSSCEGVGQLEEGVLHLLDQETYDKQVDLLSHMGCLKNVVVLQSQLEKVAQSGRQEYFSNLRQLVETEDGSTSYFVYPDLLSQHVHDRLQQYPPALSQQEEEGRRLLQTALWYQQHVNTHGLACQVQLAVSSVAVLRLVQQHNQLHPQEALQCTLVYQLVQQSGDHTLLDFMGFDTHMQEEQPEQQQKDNLFQPHLESAQVREGLRKGELVKGVMRMREECHSGMVTMWLQGVMVQVSVQGEGRVNRSINGDQVALRLHPKEQWARADGVPLAADEEDMDQRQVESGQVEEGLGTLLKSGQFLPSGEVVGILQRAKTRFCGEVVKQEEAFIFMPSDQRYPQLQVRAGSGTRLLNMKVQVELEDWPPHSPRGHAHVRRIIGPSGDSRTEGEVILLEHNVDNREFSKKVLQCLPQEGSQYRIKEEEVARRTDLRHITVMSVDPPGCKDIDDALHCRWVDQAQGLVECGVHIADVSHFVKANSPLDLEAQSRCTTVYLVDRRTDMLPKLLTENLCSLRSEVDRLAFSVLWTVHLPSGEIRDTKYAKTVIRSRRALTYEQAQNMIDDSQDLSEEAAGLRMLNQLAKGFKAERNKAGALSLASMQVKFKFDESNTHDPTDVGFYALFETNGMVEEFMLLANQAVAQQTLRHFPCNAILRRHAPPKDAIKQFSQVLHQLGYSLDYSSSKALQQSLDAISQASRHKDPFLSQLLRIITTRYMNEAQYFCSNDFSFPEYVHYGLAMSLYTHFTSPIRRYADVLVHRLLASSLDIQCLDPTLANTQKLKKICTQMNFKNRMARYAGRASSDYHTFLFFKNRAVTDSGLVSAITLTGFNVVLPKYGLEGVIKFSEQQQQENLLYFRQQNHSITSFLIKGHKIQLFQRIQVNVRVELKFFHKNIHLEYVCSEE